MAAPAPIGGVRPDDGPLRDETVIAAPPEVVFDLSLDIDAQRSSVAASNERAVGGVTSGRIELDQTVTWRATDFGIRFTMSSKVTALKQLVRRAQGGYELWR